jgi:carboxyl-terminal processing protease
MTKESGFPCARGVARTLATLLAALLVAAAAARSTPAQSLSYDRERGREMLDLIKSDIKKNYYDPTFHGLDMEARFRAADDKIKEATSIGQIFGIIAQTLMDFDDSHLYFVPPGRSARYEYGWRMQIVGDKCFVTAVKPGSDAEAKGLQAGDEIYSIDGFGPTRANFWKILYAYYSLRPRTGAQLMVTKPNGEQKQYDVVTKITKLKRVLDLTGEAGASSQDINDFERDEENAETDRRAGSRQVEVGDDLLIWKLAEFDLTDSEVDDVISKARKHKSLIIDLRGNGGGAETTLLRMLGSVFDHDVKLGDIKRRKETKPLSAKSRGDNAFKGNLVVLVDSQSGSAAELFARVVQLEKRGVIVGDRSAGAVMRSKFYDHQSGTESVAIYGASITDADITMTDGKSLEHAGVQPDRLLLPTGADLAAQRDPVLALAAALVGVKLEPEKAGAFFPYKWRK